MHSPHKLTVDSNRNTENIKIIKIVIETAILCGKICDTRITRTLLKYAK